jgi:outer membrane protein assembly factor BamB
MLFPQAAFAVVVALICMASSAACVPVSFQGPTKPFGTRTPSPSRTVIARHDLPLHEIWRKGSIRSGLNWATTSSFEVLAARQDNVYIANTTSELPYWYVLAIDAETGEDLWRTELLGLVDSLAVSADSLYVASGSGIKAFDSTSGRLLWTSNQPPPDHEGYYIFYEGSSLSFFIRQGGRHRFTSTIDLEDGSVGKIQEYQDIVAIDSRLRYFWNNQDFWVEEIAPDKVLWSTQIESTGLNWPIKAGDYLVIPAIKNAAGWHSVLVVNRDSGQKIWECLDCYASDVVVHADTLYAILRDGSVAAYEVKTGQQIWILQFMGGAEMEPNTTTYALAVTDNALYLYFGDSQELIAVSR